MPIVYLARQRTIDYQQRTPLVQLISNPAVNDCQRCQFCYYFASWWSENVSWQDYLDCVKAHKCGRESLFWTKMSVGDYPALDQPSACTPSPLFRQIQISLQARYLQFFVCDLTGYNCSSLCHYYPSRIAANQSIAACSSAHGCGRNGSFFRLLVILDQSIFSIFNYAGLLPAAGYAPHIDGTYESLTGFSIDIHDNEPEYIQVHKVSWFYIYNAMPGSPFNGCVLALKQGSQITTAYWSEEGFSLLEEGDAGFYLTSPADTLFQMLVDYGVPSDILLYSRPYLSRVKAENGRPVYTYYARSMWQVVQLASILYVKWRYVNSLLIDYVRIQISSDVWLCCKDFWNTNELPDRWATTKTAPYDLASSTYVTISSYYDPFAIYLRQIGCKETLFK